MCLVGDDLPGIPKTNAYRVQKRAIRESPLRSIIKLIVGTGVLDGPKIADALHPSPHPSYIACDV